MSSSLKNPFQILIITVLSQATADRNTARAFENLSRRFPITPKVLAETDVEAIEEAIRVGGLYRNKSRVIKAISREILETFRGSLDFIYSLPLEDARKNLLSIPGVGPKTADVVLFFCAERSTIPVDTHVNRVSKRLGLGFPMDVMREFGVRSKPSTPLKTIFSCICCLFRLGESIAMQGSLCADLAQSTRCAPLA